MFTVTVKNKTYTVERVTPRALYEMQPALEMFDKINRVTQASLRGEETQNGPDDIKEAMEVLMDWFVIFCGNQFTRDDLMDGYPADTIMTDIGVAIRSVQMQVTEAIKSFPTTARQPRKTQPAVTKVSAASRCRSTLTAWIKGSRSKK